MTKRLLTSGLFASCAALLLLAPAGTQARERRPLRKRAAKASKGATQDLLLWKVSKEGTKTSYLFGTIHLPDARVLKLPAPVEEAFEGSDAFYGELTMDPSQQLETTQRMMLAPGEDLRKILGKRLANRAALLLKRRKLPMQPFMQMKPWALISQMQLLDFLPQLQMGLKPLDGMLMARAKKAGKETGGLERAADQLELFESLSQRALRQMFKAGLDGIEKAEKKKEVAAEPLIQSYLRGDMDSILAATRRDVKKSKEGRAFLKRLLDDRNLSMAKAIDAKLGKEPQKSYFFAIGALHMAGDEGLVELLQAKGYTLERVARPAPSAPGKP